MNELVLKERCAMAQFDIGKQRREWDTLFRLMTQHARSDFCGEHAGSVSCRFCVLDTGFAHVQ